MTHKIAWLLIAAMLLGGLTLAWRTTSSNSAQGIPIGMYGTHWTPWAIENHEKLDFVFYQVSPERSAEDVCQFLQLARDSGLDVILVIILYEDAAQRSAQPQATPLLSAQNYVGHFSRIFDRCPDLPVMASTLDEENVSWQGRDKFLSELYQALKTRYPTRSFYQWYSPSANPNVPGEDWPDLPADGWIFDQYFLTGDVYRNYVRGMTLLDKPLISILWASPNWRVAESLGSYDTAWWEAEGWQRLQSGLSVNLEFAIPTAFFMFEPVSVTNARILPLWMVEAPCSKAFVRHFFANTVARIRAGSVELVDLPETRPEWLPVGCQAAVEAAGTRYHLRPHRVNRIIEFFMAPPYVVQT